MKSRFPLRTHSALQPEATTLVRSRVTRADKVSLAHRFELKHNTSPRFARRRQQRRQGQALLLAVLIMLLAALLSAGFLAVVSGNLNQTARIADKTRAIEASRAGIAYANAQLSGSSQGDLWRPTDVSPAPLPGTARYNSYYSQLDRVQGWTATTPPVRANFAAGAAGDEPFRLASKNFRDVTYGKFPDPNQSLGDAPKFLVKVEEIPTLPTVIGYDPLHAGEIKITSVGLSEDDPNVFHRSIAYKEGRRKSPWTAALRSVSNWDFDNGVVPQVTVASVVPDATTGTTKVTFFDSDLQAKFPAAPFNVVLSHKDAVAANSRTFGGVVIATAAIMASAPPATEYTIAGVAPAGIGAADTMQAAAALGMGSSIDLLNTGTPQLFSALYANPNPQANGILTNGSAWLQGYIGLSNLNKFGTKIHSAGAIALDTASKPVAAPANLPVRNYGIAGNGTLVSSNSNDFPGTFTTDSGEGVVPLDLVDDAWNKLGSPKPLGLDYSGDQTRVVEPFRPAKIDSAENLARYRALTRNSANGVYIDNRDDVEKIYDAATTSYKPMTQAQLIEMLTSTASFPVAPTPDAAGRYYTRNSPANPAATGVSLEQRHLRGWVGPEEFLARGALVELIQPTPTTAKIRVTYDARSDANPAGDTTKTFRDPNTGNLLPGVYSQTLDWPSNGTLFAEGNIRIRGDVNLPAPPPNVPDPYPSLTVVSLNNIYVEGSLSVDKSTVVVGGNTEPAFNRKKLMLLAKKNVIVNPTRAVLARTDVQTLATNTTPIQLATVPLIPGTPVTPVVVDVTVANASLFSQGDFAKVTGATLTTPVTGLVTNVNVNTNTLRINTTTIGVVPIATIAAPVIVSSPMEKREAGTNQSAQAFYSLVDTENAFNRRIYAPLQNATLNKLVFDHVADLRKNPSGATVGLRVKAVNYAAGVPLPTTGLTADLTDKQTITTTGGVDTVNADEFNVTQVDKRIRIYNSFDGGSKDEFNDPPADKTLTLFSNDISAFMGRTDGAMIAPKGYKYEGILNEDTAPLVDPDPNTRLSSIGTLPYYALAGIGLRYAPGSTTGFVNNGRKTLATDNNPPTTVPATPADATPQVSTVIPIATSVEFDLNSTLSSLITSTSNSPVPPPVPYLGFNPIFAGPDDALTVDSTFYQTRDDVLNSTLDQRVLELPNPTAPFVHSVVLKRSSALATPALSKLLPDYRIRASKLENYNRGANYARPVVEAMNINAFVYAQEGSWFVIPGDYFRSTPIVRSIATGVGNSTRLSESYIDYNDNKTPDPGEFIGAVGSRIADLNRNGRPDPGERSAALRLVRYNYFPVSFFGAIVENQTAIVANIDSPIANQPPLVKGAVQDWMDKWVSYRDTVAANVGSPNQFTFMSYTYDPAIQNGSVGADTLRVPITDDLIYEQ